MGKKEDRDYSMSVDLRDKLDEYHCGRNAELQDLLWEAARELERLWAELGLE